MENGKATATDAPPPSKKEEAPQTITLENVNGRLAELADQNQWLAGRCATMRGELADKDRIIADLRAQFIAATGDKETVLNRKDRRRAKHASRS